MQTLILENQKKVKKAIPLVESKLKVKIKSQGKTFSISGNELDEYICQQILRAVNFGFNEEDALVLTNPDYVLHFINMKEHTHKKMSLVRARVIGAKGRAKGTIEELTSALIVVKVNEIGLIVNSEHLDTVTQALLSLIKGAKHANIFAYLEKQNKNLKKFDDDLGLKPLKKSN